ncbi:hypothetical protein JQX13_12575 [Archangium violaceum]|uniref:hypothetical protein n=1 Tax=Archangium violaceum TaxID=83451 RepID=UPI00193B501E|nr:hypothetical protein [Archangium violaceum]QRK10826.1 hypothetical protein JQX13_12575 [Archangium violaceum]
MSTPAPELELRPSHVITARRGISPVIRHTPLEPNATLPKLAGAPVLLELENLQVTGRSGYGCGGWGCGSAWGGGCGCGCARRYSS